MTRMCFFHSPWMIWNWSTPGGSSLNVLTGLKCSQCLCIMERSEVHPLHKGMGQSTCPRLYSGSVWLAGSLAAPSDSQSSEGSLYPDNWSMYTAQNLSEWFPHHVPTILYSIFGVFSQFPPHSLPPDSLLCESPQMFTWTARLWNKVLKDNVVSLTTNITFSNTAVKQKTEPVSDMQTMQLSPGQRRWKKKEERHFLHSTDFQTKTHTPKQTMWRYVKKCLVTGQRPRDAICFFTYFEEYRTNYQGRLQKGRFRVWVFKKNRIWTAQGENGGTFRKQILGHFLTFNFCSFTELSRTGPQWVVPPTWCKMYLWVKYKWTDTHHPTAFLCWMNPFSSFLKLMEMDYPLST